MLAGMKIMKLSNHNAKIIKNIFKFMIVFLAFLMKKIINDINNNKNI